MKIIRDRLCFVILIFFAGCTALPTENDETFIKTQSVEYIQQQSIPDRVGIYHKVKRGETLWRIAKAYDLSISDITASNNIPNAANIEVNQLVFIPGALEERKTAIPFDEDPDEFVWPLKGRVVGYYGGGDYDNKGIDIRAEAGAEVRASRRGRVAFADYLQGYGLTVIIDHEDGFHTVYARNSQIVVDVNQAVEKNKVIAYLGRTNNLALLHFQVRKNSYEDNPMYYLPSL